ncbi:XRE family transcriptional regulator [Paeniglutamicibacter psychrophenolicus]|uniref:Transcriptional regulator with XRE-family HTH domain n=1 Tax=Paeniglutamicibacter psychrophenolicus TaxID=257454 RepID=A0ABS4WEJ5_9MICC|nr:XRE family transcriptional regulator [Paeniglutamicibacter psychrophenolicus]MBP2374553.1 transcriptional regulator with XRE-family HTH domain [Paeniglutamicibacter psychrophenolicus]
MAKTTSNPESSLPMERVAVALRRERERAGLSLSEVARRAGIGKSTLSQLESGAGNPSVETMWALSTAFGVPLSALLDPPRPAVTVIRAGEGPRLASGSADYAAALLAPSPPNARRDIYLITAEPGAIKHSEPHAPGTVEHIIMSAGRARNTVAGNATELGPGDYMSYPGDQAHDFEALEKGTFAVFVVEAR